MNSNKACHKHDRKKPHRSYKSDDLAGHSIKRFFQIQFLKNWTGKYYLACAHFLSIYYHLRERCPQIIDDILLPSKLLTKTQPYKMIAINFCQQVKCFRTLSMYSCKVVYFGIGVSSITLIVTNFTNHHLPKFPINH